MCHGPEWEYLRMIYAREAAHRNRKKAEAERSKAPAIAPPKPAEAPTRNEEPVPV